MPPSLSTASLDEDFARAEPLVRNARTRLLPTGWNDWPDGLPPRKHRLDLDKQLEDLTAGRRRILSASEVRERYSITSSWRSWPSHHTALRSLLVWYAEVEFQDSITCAAEEAPVERRRIELLDAKGESLAEYFRLTPADTELQEAFRKAKARALSYLYALRPPGGGKPSQMWKFWFVFRLATFWHIITGKQPPTSPHGDFAKLVSDAWNSLHPDLRDINWDWDTFVRRFAKFASSEDACESALIQCQYANFATPEFLSKTYPLAG
jgi:hypothetical protein